MMHHLAPKALVQLQRKNRRAVVCHPIRYYHDKLVFTRSPPNFVPGNRIITFTDQCRRHRHEGQHHRNWSPCCCNKACCKLGMHCPWEMMVGYRWRVIRIEWSSSWYLCMTVLDQVDRNRRYILDPMKDNILGSGRPHPLLILNG